MLKYISDINRKVILMTYQLWQYQKRFFYRRQLVKKNILIDSSCTGYWYIRFPEYIEGGIGIPKGCQFQGDISIGDYTTLGVCNLFFGPVEIGKYCQIGAYVSVFASNHPLNRITTYINKRLFDGRMKKEHADIAKVVIGNDVWIGHGVIILSGVTIGDGVVIGAGSVITKNIEPYSVVAGNPARLIRYRFTSSVVKQLKELQWWNKTKKELEELEPLFHKDILLKDSIYE